jgi:hypothetical protein
MPRRYVRKGTEEHFRECTRCGETKPLTEEFFYRHNKGGFRHECCGCKGARVVESKLGVSPLRYKEMLQNQRGVCAICEELDYGKRSNYALSVDHCHTTGRIRSLLCTRCNLALGYLRDNAELAERAAKYLREWNASASVKPAHGHGVGMRRHAEHVEQL